MEKPILFSTQMVQAILEGRKTQTRRVIKDEPLQEMTKTGEINKGLNRPPYKLPKDFRMWWRKKGFIYPKWAYDMQTKVDERRIMPIMMQYKTGDILWVRETVWQRLYPYPESEEAFYWGSDFKYVATDEKPDTGLWVKRPAIHMPRKAARIFLKVKNVRAEQLQDISETDAIAEGVNHQWGINHNGEKTLEKVCTTVFKELWDSINAKRGYGWDTNPWVWVIEFERVNNI